MGFSDQKKGSARETEYTMPQEQEGTEYDGLKGVFLEASRFEVQL